MTQLWWKHQHIGNRKWRKMWFQNCSKQRKLKIRERERSKHWNIKLFALGLKREIYLHPKVFTAEKLSSDRVPLQVCCTSIQESVGDIEKWQVKWNAELLFPGWILSWRLLLLAKIWRKGLKSACVFFQGYHKRYFLFSPTLPHLYSQLQKDQYCTWGRKCQNSHFSLQYLCHLSSSEIMVAEGEFCNRKFGEGDSSAVTDHTCCETWKCLLQTILSKLFIIKPAIMLELEKNIL